MTQLQTGGFHIVQEFNNYLDYNVQQGDAGQVQQVERQVLPIEYNVQQVDGGQCRTPPEPRGGRMTLTCLSVQKNQEADL